jgi:hypothetical protein
MNALFFAITFDPRPAASDRTADSREREARVTNRGAAPLAVPRAGGRITIRRLGSYTGGS